MTTPSVESPKPGSRRAFLKQCGIAAGLSAGVGFGVGCSRKQGGTTEPTTSSFDDLIGYIESEIQKKTVPGAGVMVSHHGKTVLDRSFGTYCCSDERCMPYDKSVLNLLYSVSKVLTSTVVVMAKQGGLVDYDAPVSQYVPEFKGPLRDEVTIRHCLTLSSGIPSFALGSIATDDLWKAALKRVCATEPRWKPGSRSEYHNIVGHFLAAECVRRRSEMKSWTAICKERLFNPLGAASLTFEMPADEKAVALAPQPSTLPSKGPAFEDFSPGHPGGGALGKIEDVLKVMNFHLQGGKWNGKTLIEPALFKEMHTVQYAKQIADAMREGTKPAHKTWGLGILLRGEGPQDLEYQDYGFDGRKTPSMFGQNGIDTLVTMADPTLDAAVVFMMTDAPNPVSKTAEFWSGVSERAFKGVQA